MTPRPTPRVGPSPDREVMALLLTANAELVSGVLRGESELEGDSVLAAVAATRSLGAIVDDTLHALVREARAEGRTWAEIGEVMHVSREAAFRRFGGSVTEAAPGEAGPPLAGAEAKAIEIFSRFVEGRFEEVRADFNPTMSDALPAEKIEEVHGRVTREGGAFVELGTPAARVRDGYTVVDLPIAFEKVDLRGRVAFDADGQVAGMFVLPPDAP